MNGFGTVLHINLWIAILLVISIYCVAQTVRDFRRKNYIWGIAGLVCAVFLLLTPFSPVAAKYDVPPAPLDSPIRSG